MRKIVDLVERLTDNEVILYLDKYGELTSSERPENAYANAVGKMMVTDEAGNDHGKPVFNGIAVDVYGAGEGYVYLSKYARENDHRYITYNGGAYHGDGSVTIDRTDLSKAEEEAYRIANEFYMEIKEANE